jgi:hypothetical protein
VPGAPSSIPVGTQFSPNLFDLKGFLAALVRHSGDKPAIEKAIWSHPVRIKAHKGPTRRLSSLPVEAAVAYGLLDERYAATQAAQDLVLLDPPILYAEFARHILLRCKGLRIVEAAQEMKTDGLAVTGDSLAEYLTDQGFPITIHNTAINSMRMWLEMAGVFGSRGWEVDASRVANLVGLGRQDVAALVDLNEEQRAFLYALCRVDPAGKCSAADVRELAEQILGRRIPRDSLPKRVLVDLKSLGYIDYESRGTAGGKATRLWTLPKFRKGILAPFLRDSVGSLDPVLTSYYQTSPSDIYSDLHASDTSRRGKALEAYAIHVMRLMGFRFVGWRKRAKDSTGYAEVDVVMTGLFGNSPTRWQVQCKNTPSSSVDLEDVAKEVGLLPLTKATHILIVANGRYTRDARRFADEIVATTPVTIFLLDKQDFEKVKDSPAALASILRTKAGEISRLKRGTTMWGW